MSKACLIIVGVCSVISFGSAWKIQDHRTTIAINTIEKKHKDVLDDIDSQKVENETKLLAKNKKAITNMVKRQKVSIDDSTNARSALIRLSDAADEALQKSQHSLNACNDTTNTFRIVFGECTKRYDEVAREAQGHVIDKQALIESYPELDK